MFILMTIKLYVCLCVWKKSLTLVLLIRLMFLVLYVSLFAFPWIFELWNIKYSSWVNFYYKGPNNKCPRPHGLSCKRLPDIVAPKQP